MVPLNHTSQIFSGGSSASSFSQQVSRQQTSDANVIGSVEVLADWTTPELLGETSIEIIARDLWGERLTGPIACEIWFDEADGYSGQPTPVISTVISGDYVDLGTRTIGGETVRFFTSDMSEPWNLVFYLS